MELDPPLLYLKSEIKDVSIFWNGVLNDHLKSSLMMTGKYFQVETVNCQFFRKKAVVTTKTSYTAYRTGEN